jgi:hypothetical protein
MRCRNGRSVPGWSFASTPAIEPPPRRRLIDGRAPRQRTSGFREMPASVEQDVRDRVPDFTRRPQHVHMAAISEHLPSSVEDPIYRAPKPRHDRLEPAREISSGRRLDDHVDVITLNREMHQSEARALPHLPPAPLDLGHQPG